MKWINELPQATQNKLTALIKAYCKKYAIPYDNTIMRQKICDLMYLSNDDYMVQITNILKPYI